MHLCYICLRKGLPTETEQHNTLITDNTSIKKLTNI